MEHPLGSAARPLRVAVVGSGPSGFYAAAALFKAELEVTVDMFDRLPTPFGLVRGGVAPDHQKIKNVIRVYDKTARDPRFRFFGNVSVGRDVAVAELAARYDAVIYAVGNEADRPLGIPGEDLDGVYSATEFVGWYNGHPDFQDRSFALERAKRVAVVGNGNVAMDVTRILAQDSDELHPTDITDEAVAALRTSAVEEIVLLGRRGPAQAAFSPKEIKEIGDLRCADLIVDPEMMELDELTRTWMEGEPPSTKKNVEYLTEVCNQPPSGARRRVLCRFLVSPVELLGEDGRLRAVRIEHNELQPGADGAPRPRGTGRTELLEVDLLFKAVGYRGTPLDGVPFDERGGIFPNVEGRIVDPASGQPIPGQYVVGWAKRGPTGLIGTNTADSQATVASLLADVAGRSAPEAPAKDPAATPALLRERGVDFVSYADWQRLDQDEVTRGAATGKVRLKYTDVEEMMDAVRSLRTGG
ncbi:MAG TPA: FAD-dependent oxidoreductase [Thermoanaerobaculia bacterium]|nr:FAD-dependent oxidoreductase [Thermoanaerobaculia bacterium]